MADSRDVTPLADLSHGHAVAGPVRERRPATSTCCGQGLDFFSAPVSGLRTTGDLDPSKWRTWSTDVLGPAARPTNRAERPYWVDWDRGELEALPSIVNSALPTLLEDDMTTVQNDAHHDSVDRRLRPSTAEPTLLDRLRAAAIQHFGRCGFDQSMPQMSIALDADGSTLSDLFGSVKGLRASCDEYVLSSIRTAETVSLSSRDPRTWSDQVARIESFTPLTSYLVRSLQAGDELGRTLVREMIDHAETYLETASGSGDIKPSRDPKARARLLAMNVCGGFLLYLQMHDNPTDMGAVLRSYAKEMILPALELYTQGLMADDTMYEAFLTQSGEA